MAKEETIADNVLRVIYEKLELVSDYDKYNNLYSILEELEPYKDKKLKGATWGTITERMVETQLKLFANDTFFKTNNLRDQWAGDFGLVGNPFNIMISVKSYTSKERAINSGSGSYYCSTILYGHFLEKTYKDYNKIERLLSYKLRGFTSIYMPKMTYQMLSNEALNVKNINGNSLIRKIENLGTDIKNALEKQQIGKNKRLVVNPRLI